MYKSFFEFNRRPFSAMPQVDFYFPAAAIETARQTLTRCVERSEGPALIIGPVGTGKTLLCQVLATQFASHFQICQLANSRLCSRRALLQAILFESGLDYRGLDEGELRLTLIDYLSTDTSCPNGMVLLVDEAHSVPIELLEELRMITNLIRNGESRVRLILSGLPKLEERFASPKLESFSQRIAARCYLECLNRDETANYVRYYVTTAGSERNPVFEDESLRVVYDATDGIPRLINQLCDHALVMAAVGGHRVMDGTGIQEAWTDLQQLPEPSYSKNLTPAENSAFIEFGSLDDGPSDLDSISEEMPAGLNNQDSGHIHDEKSESLEMPVVAYSGEGLDQLEQQVADAKETVVTAESDEVEPMLAANSQDATSNHEIETEPVRTVNPFDELFEEEEVVIDRCVSLNTSESNHQVVASEEGRLISALLNDDDRQLSLNAGPDPPQSGQEIVPRIWSTIKDRVEGQLERASGLANAHSTDFVVPVSQEGTDEPPDVVPYPTTLTSPYETDQVNVNDSWAIPVESLARAGISQEADVSGDVASTPKLHGFVNVVSDQETQFVSAETSDRNSETGNLAQNEVDIVLPDERDVIVVDDEVPVETTESSQVTGRARRQEYRRLFAKLRRG